MWAIIAYVVDHWGAAAMKTSIAVLASVVVCGSAAAAPNQYAVDGLAVGTQLKSDSAPYRQYKCSPSEQFAGLTWCQKAQSNKEERGAYTAAHSILHSRDGKIVYVNRTQEPAFLGAKEAEEEIQRLSRKIGGDAPRIMKMPNRAGLRNGIIAVWGNATLEQLDKDSLKILSEGKSPKQGLLIDFLGNFTRSAKEGLPVYRINGGPGFLWAASFEQKGRIRTVAVDASALASTPAVIEPTPQEPTAQSVPDVTEPETKVSESVVTIEQLQAELALANKRIAELETAKVAAETARIEADRARTEAETAAHDIEQARLEEKGELEAAIAQVNANRPARDTTSSRWENAFYGSIGGLLVALTGFGFGFIVKRVKASRSNQQSCELPVSTAETPELSQNSETESIPPALSPTIAISETAFESELEQQVVAINESEVETTPPLGLGEPVPESAEKLPVVAPA
jgi:hypothetical protein